MTSERKKLTLTRKVEFSKMELQAPRVQAMPKISNFEMFINILYHSSMCLQ